MWCIWLHLAWTKAAAIAAELIDAMKRLVPELSPEASIPRPDCAFRALRVVCCDAPVYFVEHALAQERVTLRADGTLPPPSETQW